MPIKEGDRVRITAREPTPEDEKSATYFAHFGNLTGTVQKVYNKQEVAVEVDLESLPTDVRKRHEEIRGQMKTRWLDGLSEEARSRLTEREKDFNLRYVVLVGMSDLTKIASAGRAPKPSAERGEAVAPPRKTLAELEAAEEEELRRRSGRG